MCFLVNLASTLHHCTGCVPRPARPGAKPKAGSSAIQSRKLETGGAALSGNGGASRGGGIVSMTT